MSLAPLVLFNGLRVALAYQKIKCFVGIRQWRGGGGTTRPLPRDGGAEELRGDPTVEPHPEAWTIGQE